MIKNYVSFIKFWHTIFALPFALIGFTLGWKFEQFESNNISTKALAIKLGLMLICMVTARSAAMAFNRYIDSKFDKLNDRTKNREIPSGIIKPKQALYFIFFNVVVFIITTYFINAICFYLSFVAIILILFYSFTKRFTWLCHIILGLSLSLAPIGAFLVLTGQFNLTPIFIGFAVLCWVGGFDIIYSFQDQTFDQTKKLYSIPAVFGIKNAYLIAVLLHLLCVFCLIITYLSFNFHNLYLWGLVFFVAVLLYQHRNINLNNFENINIKFMTLNGWASIGFGIFVIMDLIVF
ncbi:MAG: UbiA-like polyprenyltransferase [Alphaproteobacteria bacterium]|nr:UbiA-like polyprenyltransferase [Alphaproteobacteria bacterium]